MRNSLGSSGVREARFSGAMVKAREKPRAVSQKVSIPRLVQVVMVLYRQMHKDTRVKPKITSTLGGKISDKRPEKTLKATTTTAEGSSIQAACSGVKLRCACRNKITIKLVDIKLRVLRNTTMAAMVKAKLRNSRSSTNGSRILSSAKIKLKPAIPAMPSRVRI